MSVGNDKQSRKGLGQYYSEPKKPTMIGLTPTAVEQLDKLAAEFHLSRSEFIERIARRMIPVGKPRRRAVSSMGKHDEA
ncbi:CopG family transcriptional regulator [Leptolyngbya sp. FACHB-16]|uniref:ribbon-helix-helix domain-containing protein n=1 Tax=unclassified Leptolyngbya TaxID=2650499 RepID=UPI001684B6A2|nr:CopG family transcriptional regulator [Leptolyngbya sp. FACHB-16]MBD2158891.1 ribbon-helix-helix protein, CopG family [Leptolyngbya sp. FACHB-16]